MPNPMLSTDEEPIAAMATTEILDSPKRKADAVGLHEGGKVRILGKAISTSTSTCLTILQNAYLKFSTTPMTIIPSIEEA